ncbi:MAG: APC family permease [Acidimicrobiia bacterium]|nr:APC family permease [Acidimicrobiia bacterium]
MPKRLALPVFASDPLSSVAYATEEAMLVLSLAGAAAFSWLTPLSLGIATLLLIVIVSYRQTIKAYPEGGGAFIVANDNLGIRTGAVAAAALLIDYVLTVSVSVAAGVAAITSAAPWLQPYRVVTALGFVVLLTVANLRGVREASTLFALPTYLFVLTVGIMLVVGFAECLNGQCPSAISSGVELETQVSAVGLFLVLRAFASGSTALTGVEAIANGVQAFREPKSRNAVATLGVMGGISISMFLGISTLARWFDVRISEGTINTYGTVMSQIGRAVFNGGVGFYALQVFTAAILVLAANTAYQDFPRLSAILSRHKLTPRQFLNRGDRLVFSNGIITLALLASALLLIFGADVSRLIQLYVVGVFTAFTLSQTGMVRHWLRTREPGWRRSVVINSVGAVTTGVVLVVVASVKFVHGAWIVILLVPILVALMLSIRRHYLGVAAQLRQVTKEATAKPARVIVLVAHHDDATERSLRYAELLAAESLTCVHAVGPGSDDLLYTWDPAHLEHPLEVLAGESEPISRRVVDRIRQERDTHPGALVTVILADRVRSRSILAFFVHRHSLAIKSRLLFEPGVVVTDLNVVRRFRQSRRSQVPISHVEQVVLISDMTRPIREALTYAESLGFPVIAVHIDVDPRQSQRLESEWEAAGYQFPLEILASPYRSIVDPLVRYLRDRRRAAAPGTLICVVIPEFVVPGRIAQLLHNQTGLAIKVALAGEHGIAVTSVPYHLRTIGDHASPSDRSSVNTPVAVESAKLSTGPQIPQLGGGDPCEEHQQGMTEL